MKPEVGKHYVAHTGRGIHACLRIVKVVSVSPLRARIRTVPGRLVYARGAGEMFPAAFRREATPREVAVGMVIHPVAHPEAA